MKGINRLIEKMLTRRKKQTSQNHEIGWGYLSLPITSPSVLISLFNFIFLHTPKK